MDDAIVVVENVERLIAEGMIRAGRHAQSDGRGRIGIDSDDIGVDRGVRSDGLCSGNQRSVLSAICVDDFDLDRDLDVCFVDVESRAVCDFVTPKDAPKNRFGRIDRQVCLVGSSGCSTARLITPATFTLGSSDDWSRSRHSRSRCMWCCWFAPGSVSDWCRPDSFPTRTKGYVIVAINLARRCVAVTDRQGDSPGGGDRRQD